MTNLDKWRTQVNATMKKLYGITLEDAGVPVEYLELTSAANHDPREWVDWFAGKHGLEAAQPTATTEDTTTTTQDYLKQRATVVTQIADFVARLNAKHGGTRDSFYSDKPGPKFTRIVHESWGSRVVQCFVDNATGDILKANGWKGPAKGVRGHVTDEVPENSLHVYYYDGYR